MAELRGQMLSLLERCNTDVKGGARAAPFLIVNIAQHNYVNLAIDQRTLTKEQTCHLFEVTVLDYIASSHLCCFAFLYSDDSVLTYDSSVAAISLGKSLHRLQDAQN